MSKNEALEKGMEHIKHFSFGLESTKNVGLMAIAQAIENLAEAVRATIPEPEPVDNRPPPPPPPPDLKHWSKTV